VLLAVLVIVTALGLAIAGRDTGAPSARMARPPELVLDVNHAPLRALAALPHLGPTLARRLDEARTERPFSSLEEVRNRVRGIGPVTLARISRHLRIETPPASAVRSEKLASARPDRPGGPQRAPRRRVTRARKPASTPRQPGLDVQAQEQDSRRDFTTVADRE
jgi:hypothetical protein